MKKEIDITILGATGYTGTLISEYFANRKPNLKWAIAGRNRSKLESLKSRLEKSQKGLDIPIIIAEDQASLDVMAQKSKSIITTVGPYIKYGEGVVKACTQNSCDYLDLTGEPAFVKMIREKYHKIAEKNGVVILTCCGFDSIPADLGTYYTCKELDKTEATVRCYVSTNGKPSGGTWNSALLIMSQTGMGDARHITGNATRSIPEITDSIHEQKQLSTWALPMPVVDVAMVEKSHEVNHYADRFQYAQYFASDNLPKTLAIAAGVGAVFAGSRVPFIRDMLGRLLPPGEGPSLEERNQSTFELTFIGESPGKKVRATVSGGDPGYTETSKIISEAAITLFETRDKVKIAGVLSPASVLKDELIENLQRAGIRFNKSKA